ncbi:MAG: phage terminase large subunit [Clostridiales bacterium]|jgi:PBSX family phage terminase large subunit|nr:phage terminase large subunit [Clostridiales bacterium]
MITTASAANAGLKRAKFYDFLMRRPAANQILEFVLYGGRTAGKTQHIASEIVECVSERPGFNAIACRANVSDLAGSVRAVIVKKIEEAGLSADYRVPEAALTITNIRNGNKIYFRAYEKAITRTKGDEPQGDVGIVWIEEANEARDPLFLDAALTTYYRFMPRGRVFYSFNPMPQPSHWSHDYFAKKKLSKDTVYRRCNWTHVARLLSPSVLRKIIDAKRANPKYYAFWYRGELVSFDGLIFPQWDRAKHYVPPDRFLRSIRAGDIPRLLLFAVDGGTKRDMTAVAPLCFMRSRQLVLLDRYYHNPIKTMPIAPGRQAGYINAFADKVTADYPELAGVPIAFVFDSDGGSQEILLQLRHAHNRTACAVAKKHVWQDIYKFQDLLDANMFYAVNTNGYRDYEAGRFIHTDPFIDEIESYCFDPVTNDVKSNQVDHMLKAIIYGVKSLYADPRLHTVNLDFLKQIDISANFLF